ncbi:MAG: hypothetical protein ACREUW_13730 [Burkholderiales bacterium]
MRVRTSTPNWLFGGAHFVIILIAGQTESRLGWALGCVAMAAVSFFAWIANYGRYRLIADVPLSQVATAAQGYAELIGRTEILPGCELRSPYRNVPILWCRYRKEKKKGDNWRTEESGEIGDVFNLRDDSGVCTVNLDRAEVHCNRQDQWLRDGYRYTETRISPGDRVYALGEFSSRAQQAGLTLGEELNLLLNRWKADRAGLLARFDANGDGEIDPGEWEAARAAARRVVEPRQLKRAIEAPVIHTLQKPADGRHFLISTDVQDSLAARFRWWSIVHVIVFLGAAAGAVVLFN